jgi:hypothetical protein
MTVAKTHPSLAAEIKRASTDLEVDSEGRVWYKPTHTPLFRIAERDGTAWLQTLRGHDIGPATDRKDFWEAVNAVANLAFRLEELADAAQVRKQDLVLDRAGNAISARAGDAEYRYSIEARPGKTWKLSDSIVVAGEERQLNFKAIKPVLKKAAARKPVKKAEAIEEKVAEHPTPPTPPPPPVPEKPSQPPPPEPEIKTEEQPETDMPEQVAAEEEEPSRVGGAGTVAVLDGDLGKKIFTVFAEINAVRLHVELGDNRLVVYALDASHVMMALFNISRAGMKSYSLGSKALSRQKMTYEPRYAHLLEDLAKQYTYDIVRLIIKPDKLVIELLKNSRTVKKEMVAGLDLDPPPIPRLPWRHRFTVEIDDVREVIRHVDMISDGVTLVAMEENPAYLYVRAKNTYDTYRGYVSKLRISDAAIPSKFAVMYSVSYLRWVFDIMRLFTDGVVSVDIAGGTVLHGYDLATVLRVSHSHDGVLVEVLVAPKIVDDEEREKFVNLISNELGRITSVPAYESVRRYAEVLENRGADITMSIQWPKELGGYIKVVDMLRSNIYIYIQKDAIWFTADGHYTGAREETEAALSFGGVKVAGIETGYIHAELGEDIIRIMSRFLPRASSAPYLSYYKESEYSSKLYFSIEDEQGTRHIFQTTVSPHISYDYHKMAPEEWWRPRDAETLYRAEADADDVKAVLSKYRGGGRVEVNASGRLSITDLDLRGKDGGSGVASIPAKPLYISDGVVEAVRDIYIDAGELREAVTRLGRLSDKLVIEILKTSRKTGGRAGHRLTLSLYAEDPNTRTKAAVHLY